MRKKLVNMDVLVEVEINDEDVIDRVTGPEGDEWRKHMYDDMHTEDDVLAHLAANRIANDVTTAKRLEGFADLELSACTMNVVSAQLISTSDA